MRASTQKVLVVNPHPNENLLLALSRAGFKTLTATDSEEGMRMLYECHPSAVIMSDDVSPIGGKHLYARLREIAMMPCIVVGNKAHEERAMMIEDGADLYLDNLLGHGAFIAYLRSLLNRYNQNRMITIFDADSKSVELGDAQTELTDVEFRLLSCLAYNEGTVMSYSDLLTEVWGRETSLETVHLYVRRLKQKLGIDGVGPYRLLNRWGAGYCFCMDKVSLN